MNLKKILPLILIPGLVVCGNTGKIAGKVTDAQTGEPIVGVNVVVEGTYLGAATDFDGNYTIINVPPGSVRFQLSQLKLSNPFEQVVFPLQPQPPDLIQSPLAQAENQPSS